MTYSLLNKDHDNDGTSDIDELTAAYNTAAASYEANPYVVGGHIKIVS